MNNPNKSGLRISAVTIAKNEEQNIGRWLQSVKHYADEVIVVDTEIIFHARLEDEILALQFRLHLNEVCLL